jgi:hypothetical protein
VRRVQSSQAPSHISREKAVPPVTGRVSVISSEDILLVHWGIFVD